VLADKADERIAQMEGAAALPRKNGELVFAAPWEGRAFGLAVALSDRRVYDWEEFRAQLIAEIASSDARGGESSYYECWLAACEKVLLAHGLVTSAELDQRTHEYVSGERSDEDHDHDEDAHDHASA
jgi:nitrile hydratase accessory protein